MSTTPPAPVAGRAALPRRLAALALLAGLAALAGIGWAGRDALRPLLGSEAAPLLAGLALALGVVLAAGAALLFLGAAVAGQAAGLTAAAESVARGDLATQHRSAPGPLGRLWLALGRTRDTLRGLALARRRAARDSSELAARNTAGAETAARRAEDTARTAAAVSRHASVMARTIDALGADAARLSDTAADVASSAHEGAARNRQLRDLTLASRARLDEGTHALERLSEDVRVSAGAADALAGASEEIRSFVELVQRMARQTKLLSLNAAMEAARAGEEGEGFGVVAGEIRRLAAESSTAARSTEAAVAAILERVELSRALAARTVGTVDAALEATRAGKTAADAVAAAVATAEEWTASVEQAADVTSRLVQEMTERVEALGTGTHAVATAIGEVSTASEAQRTTTREIAASASALVVAGQHLSSLAATFRLGDEDAAPPPVQRPEGGYRPTRLTPFVMPVVAG